jgi:hypothetical protein
MTIELSIRNLGGLGYAALFGSSSLILTRLCGFPEVEDIGYDSTRASLTFFASWL